MLKAKISKHVLQIYVYSMINQHGVLFIDTIVYVNIKRDGSLAAIPFGVTYSFL